MSIVKDLKKQHKKLEIEIKKITKTRLNDRASSSWRELKELKKKKLQLKDKITKIYGFCNVCGLEATKTFRKIKGGSRTQVGSANIYAPRCLKHWEPR